MIIDGKNLDIKSLIRNDLDILDSNIANIFCVKNEFNEILHDFLMAPSKRLRPMLGLLFSKCLHPEINSKQHNILLAVELIHNATLIHDDVIDNSKTRRGKQTINSKFDANLAVIAGDFLLSTALEKIITTGSLEAIKNCTSALKTTCLGEVDQYFSKGKITSIEDYIEKSREKTALLFELSVLNCVILSDEEVDENIKEAAIDFAQNFGIAFQIRDDLINILNCENSIDNDINEGIYTAPIIFASQEAPEIFDKLPLNKDILNVIKNTQAIEKTKNLMDNYFKASLEATKVFGESIYREAIFDLADTLKTGLW